MSRSFDDKISKKLSEFSDAPTAADWQQFEAVLGKNRRKKGLFFWWKWIGLALVALLPLAFVMLNQIKPASKNALSNSTVASNETAAELPVFSEKADQGAPLLTAEKGREEGINSLAAMTDLVADFSLEKPVNPVPRPEAKANSDLHPSATHRQNRPDRANKPAHSIQTGPVPFSAKADNFSEKPETISQSMAAAHKQDDSEFQAASIIERIFLESKAGSGDIPEKVESSSFPFGEPDEITELSTLAETAVLLEEMEENALAKVPATEPSLLPKPSGADFQQNVIVLFRQYSAYTGYLAENSIRADYRNKWFGWDGTPRQFQLAWDQAIPKWRIGTGLHTAFRKEGLLTILEASWATAWHHSFSEKTRFSAGNQFLLLHQQFGGLASRENFDASYSGTQSLSSNVQEREEILSRSTTVVSWLNPSLWLQSGRIYTGLNLLHLSRPNGSFSENKEPLKPEIALTAGYHFALGANHVFTPSAEVVLTGKEPAFQAQGLFLFWSKVYAGGGYQRGDYHLMAGARLFGRMQFVLTYGLPADKNIRQLQPGGTISAYGKILLKPIKDRP